MTDTATRVEHVNTTTIRAGRQGESSRSKRGLSNLWFLFAAGMAVVVAGPVILFFSRAFEEGGTAFARVLEVPGIGQTLVTTIGLAAGSTLVGAVGAVVLAACAARVSPRLRGFAAIVPQIPLVIPPVAFIYGWIFLLAPDVGYINTLMREIPFLSGLSSGPVNVYTAGGIILITAVDMSALIFAFVYPRLLEINGSVEAAARVAGASSFRSFTTIIFPLLRPGLVAGMVVAFLTAMGQFTAPLLLGTRDNIKVISTEIFRLREQFPVDYPLTAVLGLPLLIFGILAITIQRRVVGDQRRYVTQSSGRGMARPNSRGANSVIITYAVVVVALPLLAVALVAFSPYWNGDLFNLTFSTANVQKVLSDPSAISSIFNSLGASTLAVLIVIPIGFVTALILSGIIKVPSLVGRVMDYVFIAPLAVPRALLGMVVIFVFIRPPFSLYGSLALFVIGYIFVAMPFALRSQYSSLIGVDKGLFEASRVCGAGQLTMLRTVALPVARRGIAAALALAFVMLAGDFAVSVIIASPGQQVMGTMLFVYAEQGDAPSVAVMSLIMTIVTAAVLALMLRVGGKSTLESM